MAGGLLQLIAITNEDNPLIKNPQFSHFTKTFKRHTLFSTRPFTVRFLEHAVFGHQVTCKLKPHGDLINKIYAVIDLPTVDVRYKHSIHDANQETLRSLTFQTVNAWDGKPSTWRSGASLYECYSHVAHKLQIVKSILGQYDTNVTAHYFLVIVSHEHASNFEEAQLVKLQFVTVIDNASVVIESMATIETSWTIDQDCILKLHHRRTLDSDMNATLIARMPFVGSSIDDSLATMNLETLSGVVVPVVRVVDTQFNRHLLRPEILVTNTNALSIIYPYVNTLPVSKTVTVHQYGDLEKYVFRSQSNAMAFHTHSAMFEHDRPDTMSGKQHERHIIDTANWIVTNQLLNISQDHLHAILTTMLYGTPQWHMNNFLHRTITNSAANNDTIDTSRSAVKALQADLRSAIILHPEVLDMHNILQSDIIEKQKLNSYIVNQPSWIAVEVANVNHAVVLHDDIHYNTTLTINDVDFMVQSAHDVANVSENINTLLILNVPTSHSRLDWQSTWRKIDAITQASFKHNNNEYSVTNVLLNLRHTNPSLILDVNESIQLPVIFEIQVNGTLIENIYNPLSNKLLSDTFYIQTAKGSFPFRVFYASYNSSLNTTTITTTPVFDPNNVFYYELLDLSYDDFKFVDALGTKHAIANVTPDFNSPAHGIANANANANVQSFPVVTSIVRTFQLATRTETMVMMTYTHGCLASLHYSCILSHIAPTTVQFTIDATVSDFTDALGSNNAVTLRSIDSEQVSSVELRDEHHGAMYIHDSTPFIDPDTEIESTVVSAKPFDTLDVYNLTNNAYISILSSTNNASSYKIIKINGNLAPTFASLVNPLVTQINTNLPQAGFNTIQTSVVEQHLINTSNARTVIQHAAQITDAHMLLKEVYNDICTKSNTLYARIITDQSTIATQTVEFQYTKSQWHLPLWDKFRQSTIQVHLASTAFDTYQTDAVQILDGGLVRHSQEGSLVNLLLTIDYLERQAPATLLSNENASDVLFDLNNHITTYIESTWTSTNTIDNLRSHLITTREALAQPLLFSLNFLLMHINHHIYVKLLVFNGSEQSSLQITCNEIYEALHKSIKQRQEHSHFQATNLPSCLPNTLYVYYDKSYDRLVSYKTIVNQYINRVVMKHTVALTISTDVSSVFRTGCIIYVSFVPATKLYNGYSARVIYTNYDEDNNATTVYIQTLLNGPDEFDTLDRNFMTTDASLYHVTYQSKIWYLDGIEYSNSTYSTFTNDDLNVVLTNPLYLTREQLVVFQTLFESESLHFITPTLYKDNLYSIQLDKSQTNDPFDFDTKDPMRDVIGRFMRASLLNDLRVNDEFYMLYSCMDEVNTTYHTLTRERNKECVTFSRDHLYFDYSLYRRHMFDLPNLRITEPQTVGVQRQYQVTLSGDDYIYYLWAALGINSDIYDNFQYLQNWFSLISDILVNQNDSIKLTSFGTISHYVIVDRKVYSPLEEKIIELTLQCISGNGASIIDTTTIEYYHARLDVHQSYIIQNQKSFLKIGEITEYNSSTRFGNWIDIQYDSTSVNDAVQKYIDNHKVLQLDRAPIQHKDIFSKDPSVIKQFIQTTLSSNFYSPNAAFAPTLQDLINNINLQTLETLNNDGYIDVFWTNWRKYIVVFLVLHQCTFDQRNMRDLIFMTNLYHGYSAFLGTRKLTQTTFDAYWSAVRLSFPTLPATFVVHWQEVLLPMEYQLMQYKKNFLQSLSATQRALEQQLARAQELLIIRTLQHYHDQLASYETTHTIVPHDTQSLLDTIQHELGTPPLRFLNVAIITQSEEVELNNGLLPDTLEYIEHAHHRKAFMRGFTLNFSTQKYTRVLYTETVQVAIDTLTEMYQKVHTENLTDADIDTLFTTILLDETHVHPYVDIPSLLSLQRTLFSQYSLLVQAFDKYNSSYLYDNFKMSTPISLKEFFVNMLHDVVVPVLFPQKLVANTISQPADVMETFGDVVDRLLSQNVHFAQALSLHSPHQESPNIGTLMIQTQTRHAAPNTAWIESIGHYLIKTASLCIDDNVIDLFDGDFLNVHHELQPNTHPKAYSKMIGNVKLLTEKTTMGKPAYKLYIPLPFFCEKTPLPIIAITHHTIMVKIKLANFDECFLYDSSTQIATTRGLNATLLVNYITLDQPERKLFVENKHDLLVNTIQYNQSQLAHPPLIDVDLIFSSPCKEIFWIIQPDSSIQSKHYHQYTMNGESCLHSAKLKLMGVDRTTWHSSTYFESVIPAATHGSSPLGIGVYSFAFDPTSLQPSGICPFDAIDDKYMRFQLNPKLKKSDLFHIKIWARSYNVLRIMGGQAALLY